MKFNDARSYLECLKVVDEYIWHPEIVDEVEIHRIQEVLVNRAEKKEDFGEVNFIRLCISITALLVRVGCMLKIFSDSIYTHLSLNFC